VTNNWKHLYFFDKQGKNYNMKYDDTADKWYGDIFLPEVSIDLFEVGQIFVLQKMINATTGAFEFGFPHDYVDGSTADPTGKGGCGWEVEWKTNTPKEIFLFQFDKNFDTGTQSALVQEPDGPPLVKVDKLFVPLDFDDSQKVNGEGYIITDDIRSLALQVNITFSSSQENTYKRTLIITDKCTNTVVAEFTVYAESIEEDERLRVMTQNMGYSVIASDSTVFRDTNLKEALPDYVEINTKRKEIMMEGSNIYPFIGSYKGLINAIKFFGYDNLKLKEFWKNVNGNSPQFGNYIQSNAIDLFSPTVQFDDKSITLPNKNFRKTSMFELIYRINRIVPDSFTDEDLPKTEELQDFTIEEILIKLFGLKRKLENEYLPLNAHIKGITAEADFFGLLEVTNTISRNDTNTIRAGLKADFEVNPKACTYLEDLRIFNEFCLKEGAIVGKAIIESCNAYINPLRAGTQAVGSNMVIDYVPGQVLPPPPIGPDTNSVLGALESGENVTVSDIAGVFLAYFARYALDLDRTQADFVPGESSKSLPDKPGAPSGAIITLNNTSTAGITWDNVNSTWDQLSNANDFFTFDFNIQAPNVGDIYQLTDSVTGSSVSHTVLATDTVQTITTSLYDQIVLLKNTQTDPWLWFDWSQIDNVIGPAIRCYGNDVNRFVPSVILANSNNGGQFTFIQQPGETLYTWDGINYGNIAEIEWTVYKDETPGISPPYFFTIRGPIAKYNTLPIVLPYVGDYSVEMKLFDMYNNISSIVKMEEICVDSKEVEYSGWYQARKSTYTWDAEGKYKWNDYGSLWNLPIEPSVTWDEETPSLYESLDRVNAILNNFGIGTNTDFQIRNFQDGGKASFSGPYQWKNLNDRSCTWDNGFHLWWDMTATTGDTPAFFQFSTVVPNSYLKIVDRYGTAGQEYFDFSVTTLGDAVDILNVSTNPIINKYVYNLVMNAASSEIFVQAVARYYGHFGDFTSVDMVDVDGIRICADGTGNATDYVGGPLEETVLYPPFDRSLAINGVTLLGLPELGGTEKVSDEFIKKVARVYEMILDPDGPNINYNKQAAVLQSLQSKKTIQRIGYEGMGAYFPPLESYAGWDQTNDDNANVDFIWELDGVTPQDKITEVLEHALHTITTFGLPGAYPNVFNQTSPYGPTYNAMSEAINNGVFDISGYTQQPGESNDEFNALLMREYLYLLIYSEWGFVAPYISGGSLSPEWTPITATDVEDQNPLGHSLYTTYIQTLLAKPNTDILDSMFATGGLSGYIPFEDNPIGGNIDCLSRIYKSSQSISNNPTWNTAKFINDGKVLPPMTWAMFVYDKCRIVWKDEPKWTITNTTNSSAADIYFNSKYLTYLFKDPGKYVITLELIDSNGNKYKKDRNILNIKQIK